MRCPLPHPSPTCPQPPTTKDQITEQNDNIALVTFLSEATRPAKVIVVNHPLCLTIAIERRRALVDAHDQSDAALQMLVGEVWRGNQDEKSARIKVRMMVSVRRRPS